MKFANNNKAVVNNLTIKSLKANKLRNVFAVIGIIMTTILFTTLFTIGLGFKKSMQEQTMRQVGTSAHGTFKNLTKDQFEKIKANPNIKEFGCSVFINNAENKELSKINTEIRYLDKNGASMFFCTPKEGSLPEKENEIATDTAVLDALGVKHKLGEKIRIEYLYDTKKVSKEMILSGFWESDNVLPASTLIVSQKYIEANLKDKVFGKDIFGKVTMDVKFKNSFNLENKMKEVITDIGENVDNVPYGVNWAYLDGDKGVDIGTIGGVIGSIALILFTGYLIIYNIFQISVIKDIKFFGLLKTIGTTSKQIKKIIINQALILSAIAIPIGLIIGYIIGVLLLPNIIGTSKITNTSISASPIIFVAATLFSLITVLISCNKPNKIASKVSPIEATRYVDITINNKKEKRTSKGNKIFNMAKYNVERNKKKTWVVIISMSLSLVLLNSIVSVTTGFSMEKYLKKVISSDFIIANSDFYNISKAVSEEDTLEDKTIENIKNIDGFKGGGMTYFDAERDKILNSDIKPEIYGLDDFILKKLEVFEGELDTDKLKTGKYIIEGCTERDNGKIDKEDFKYKIGDKVTIDFKDNEKKEYEVLARIKICNGTDDIGTPYGKSTNLYLPSAEYIKEVKKPIAMTYQFDVKDNALDKFETKIEDYTKNIKPELQYKSKKAYISEFDGLKNMIILVGGACSLIVGIIGIVNFINAIITSVISRKREFAMLQSIGMTNVQMKKMLVIEGLFYTVSTLIMSVLLSSIISVTIIRGICNSFWFCKYIYTLKPILIIAPILLIISIGISVYMNSKLKNTSIVERLREE